eukprot:885132-Alexandrium_andersonii.AAC.1
MRWQGGADVEGCHALNAVWKHSGRADSTEAAAADSCSRSAGLRPYSDKRAHAAPLLCTVAKSR